MKKDFIYFNGGWFSMLISYPIRDLIHIHINNILIDFIVGFIIFFIFYELGMFICSKIVKEEENTELEQWKTEWLEMVHNNIEVSWERIKLTGKVKELEKENQELFENGCTARSKLRILKNDYEVLDTKCKMLEESYKYLQKENAELEAQIEKMKCCSNCIHLANCDLSGYEECKNFDKWELREIKEK